MVLSERHADDGDVQWDPLAPVAYREESPSSVIDEAAPPPSDSPEIEDQPLSDQAGDGGFSDALGVARVWLEDGRLTRVRISSNWRTRLETESGSLADCVNAALLSASLHMEPEADALPPISDDELIPIQSREEGERLLDELMQRHQEWLARPELVPEPATTRAHHAGVTAVLDAGGRLVRVEFTESWLARSETTTINNSIVAAAQKAYREHVPINELPEQAELQGLTHELAVLQASHLAWMNRGDWR